ncbi:focadhesin-like [Gigantopelta aegis]|uniref:focadhesin-like n=1 Tax=Gigantopelta aegis TaxID=1735272 RepID=UPI001B88AEA4|nr:focadhesin-like [Gigantopelta aegis]
MEDVKRRLQFQNPGIQVQAVWKLYTLLKKKSEVKPIDSSIPEIPELKQLWELCSHGDQVTAPSSCQALVKLVSLNLADFTFILNGLLNLVPTARNLLGIVCAVRDLLVLQARGILQNKDGYTSPFSIRNPPHPFITILINRPDSWPVLQQQVHHVCCHHDNSIREISLDLLSGFIKFVFLEPQQMTSYQLMRNGLQRALLDACYQVAVEDAIRIVSFLTSLLPAFQLVSADRVCTCSELLSELVQVILVRRLELSPQATLRQLVSAGFSLIRASWATNLDSSGLQRRLLQLAQVFPQSVDSEVNLVTLSELLVIFNGYETQHLLEIGQHVLKVLDDCCSLVAAMMTLPLLQIVSLPPSPVVSPSQQKSLSVLAADLLSCVHKALKSSSSDDKKGHKVWPSEIESSLTSEGYSNQTCVSLAHALSSSTSTATTWLEKVQQNVCLLKCAPHNITNLAAALLVTSTSKELTEVSVFTLVQIARVDHSQAPSLLPLLLYKLSRENDPNTKLVILEAIPLLAVDKICVPPLLKTIQLIGQQSQLKALSIRLLTSLWKLQDRVFPHLLKALTTSDSDKPSQVDEVVLAKSAAIRDICQLRPAQHGADLLSILSDILNKHGGESGAAACGLALEALVSLCQSEVIDVRSAWSALSAKLLHDSRPTVVDKICSLFALVPSVAVQTPEFEVFQTEVVMNLWLYCHSHCDEIRGSAYQALAAFTPNHFRVSFLPRQVTEDFHQQAAAMIEEQEKPELTVDDILPFVPGCCYTRLLDSLSTEVLKDYEVFLSSMVASEVQGLPRGIYYTSLRRQGAATNHGKAIDSIPAFILSKYEKCNQPGLTPALTAGLLFCHDPVVVVGRDGRPRRHYIVTHGKTYRQMLSTLLHEVPIQPSEWHRTMLTPQAWTSLIDRVYIAIIESRKAELEVQIRNGDIDTKEAKHLQDSLWLEVRDLLADMIKETSRGNPTMQGNSVLALAGLAVSVSRFASSLDKKSLQDEGVATQHIGHSHWLTVVMDTIMHVMDVTFKPKEKLLGLCQQRSATDRIQASLLARSSACLALAELIPILITMDTERIYKILIMITQGLPGKAAKDSSPVFQFYSGLALGMFLGRLFEEHFSNLGGTKGMVEVWKSLEILEDCCLATDLENRSGSLLGLGLAISGLCEEGKTDSRVHVASIQEKLMGLLDHTDVKQSEFEAICVSLACISGRAFGSNNLTIERVNATVDSLHRLHLEHPQVTGLSLALGMLCYSLGRASHPTIGQKSNKLMTDWMNVLSSENTPLEKVAALNGLMALVGSERTLVSVQSSSSAVVGADVNISKVIKMASQVISMDTDLGIQCNAAWMLGHLYLSACSVSETRASAPPSYAYLPESSILRSVVELLLEAGKRGPEFVPKEHVKVVLTALLEEVKQVMPPLNWAGVLSPFMRLDFGVDVQCLSLRLAVVQSSSSVTAAMFLSTWLTAPLINTLESDCLVVLYNSLPHLIKCLSPEILNSFIEHGSTEAFSSPNVPQCTALLEGVKQGLMVKDPPESVTAIMYQAVGFIYKLMPANMQLDLYRLMAECLCNLPDETFDRITENDFNQSDTQLKGVFVRCYAVANGRQPCALLNLAIDSMWRSRCCNDPVIQGLLAHCFYQSMFVKVDCTGTLPRLQWLLELMGHVKNIATGTVTLSEQAQPLNQVIESAVDIVACAVGLWTTSSAANSLGLQPLLLSVDITDSDTSSKRDVTQDTQVELITDSDTSSKRDVTRDTQVELITSSLSSLLWCIENMEKEPWDQISPKVIDFLSTLTSLEHTALSESCKTKLTSVLLMMRHSKSFRKPAVWTRVYSTMGDNSAHSH